MRCVSAVLIWPECCSRASKPIGAGRSPRAKNHSFVSRCLTGTQVCFRPWTRQTVCTLPALLARAWFHPSSLLLLSRPTSPSLAQGQQNPGGKEAVTRRRAFRFLAGRRAALLLR